MNTQDSVLSAPTGSDRKLSEKPWFIVLMLFLFAPVGIWLFFSNKHISKKVKIVSTVAVLALAILGKIVGTFPSSKGSQAFNQISYEASDTWLSVSYGQKEAVAEQALARFGDASWTDDQNAAFIDGFISSYTRYYELYQNKLGRDAFDAYKQSK